jgi:hypothetical protein
MRNIKNVMQKIEEMTGNIDPYYDMSIGNMREINKNSKDSVALICNSFKFGYLQGIKAERARKKR